MVEHEDINFLSPKDQELLISLESKYKIDSLSLDELIDLASLSVKMHGEESAFDFYKEVLSNDPENIKAKIWYSYWYLQYMHGNEKELVWVIKIANELIGLKDELASVGYRIKEFAVSNINYKNYKERIELLKKAIDICPRWSMNHQGIATAYFYSNKGREALKHFKLAYDYLNELSNPEWGPAEEDYHYYFTGNAQTKEGNEGILQKIEKLNKELGSTS